MSIRVRIHVSPKLVSSYLGGIIAFELLSKLTWKISLYLSGLVYFPIDNGKCISHLIYPFLEWL